MDTLKTKTARSNHVVFNSASILCTSTWCRIYNKIPCTHWYANVSMNILLWKGHRRLMNNPREIPEI